MSTKQLIDDAQHALDHLVSLAAQNGDISVLNSAAKHGHDFCPTLAMDAGRAHQIKVLEWMRNNAATQVAFPYDPRLAAAGVLQPHMYSMRAGNQQRFADTSRTNSQPANGARVMQFLAGDASVPRHLRFSIDRHWDSGLQFSHQQQVAQKYGASKLPNLVPIRSRI